MKIFQDILTGSACLDKETADLSQPTEAELDRLDPQQEASMQGMKLIQEILTGTSLFR